MFQNVAGKINCTSLKCITNTYEFFSRDNHSLILYISKSKVEEIGSVSRIIFSACTKR